MTSAPSPFAALPGAVLAEGGAPAPLHYGGFLREQRELMAGRAVVDLAGLGILRLEGADRRTWLDSLTTQRLRGLQAGESAEALLLSPEGRIEHAFGVLDDGEALLLLVERDAAEPLRAWLHRMRFMLDVRIADAGEELRAVAWLAPAADAEDGVGAVVGELAPGARVWRDPWSAPPGWAVSYRAEGAEPEGAWPLAVAIVDPSEHAALAEAVAAGRIRAAGLIALEALRIAAWRPRAGAEIDARAIPHELDWLRSAVHLDKGCYRGQETVAKVHNLGHPPRRLAMLHLDGSGGELPEPGALLALQGAEPGPDGQPKPVGRITSAAVHADDGPIALALLKRTLDPAAVLEAPLPGGGVATAAQTVIVDPGAGRNVDVPRIGRISGRAADRRG